MPIITNLSQPQKMKNQIKLIRIKTVFLLSLLTVSACSNPKGWVYRSNNYESLTAPTRLQNSSIAVLPFSDKRSNDNSNNYMLYLVPLMPFGYQNLGSPESVQIHANSGLWLNFNPKEDFAKAMAEELNSAKIFRESFFSNSTKDSDYYVSGEVISTDYNAKLFSYGLSVYGPILWFVGLPATHVANDLEIKINLIETKSKKVIFTKNYKADHYSKVGWVYSLPNDFRYPEMLADLYKKFIKDLSELK